MAALCDHYQAVTEGKIRNLLVNVPPGTSKSLLTSVLWPAWEWATNSETRWFFASYDQALSLRDSVKCRTLINSRWYQARWGHVYKLTGDQDAKQLFATDKGGYRLATSITGHGTGEHPHRIVVDDPQDRKKAESEVERKNVKDWWEQTMSTRGVSLKATKTVVMQRLHMDDLSGIVLQDPEGWDHICLPMRYEPPVMSKETGQLVPRMRPTALGWTDPRTKKGELLAPKQFPEEEVRKLEKTLRAYGTAGQLQQRPAPAEGGIIQESWWKFYDELPIPFDKVLFSWDATFDKTDDSDYVVGQCWGLKGADAYLLDQTREQMEFTETVKAVVRLRAKWAKWPKLLRDQTAVLLTLIENKANGPAIISSLRHEVPGIVPWPPKGTRMESKEARLQAVTPAIESGNVYLPLGASFTRSLMDEARDFPNGAHDDQLDAMSQALTRLLPGMWNPAEKEEPPPTNLMDMRAKQLRDAMAEAMKPQDETVPSRYGYLNR